MEKTLLERMYVSEGYISKEEYKSILTKLEELDIDSLKRLFSVYMRIQIIIADILKELNIKEDLDILKHREEKFKYVYEKDDVRNFLKDRVKSNYDLNINEKWKINLIEIEKELRGKGIKNLINIGIVSNTLSSYIDMILMQKDVLWMPINAMSVYFYIESGKSLYVEKERIWQPKS